MVSNNAREALDLRSSALVQVSSKGVPQMDIRPLGTQLGAGTGVLRGRGNRASALSG